MITLWSIWSWTLNLLIEMKCTICFPLLHKLNWISQDYCMGSKSSNIFTCPKKILGNSKDKLLMFINRKFSEHRCCSSKDAPKKKKKTNRSRSVAGQRLVSVTTKKKNVSVTTKKKKKRKKKSSSSRSKRKGRGTKKKKSKHIVLNKKTWRKYQRICFNEIWNIKLGKNTKEENLEKYWNRQLGKNTIEDNLNKILEQKLQEKTEKWKILEKKIWKKN